MGLNFTLNHPHCPQQMTNARLIELQSCWLAAASIAPLPPHMSFRPHKEVPKDPEPGMLTGPGYSWGSVGA
jgi:hypothetical protein